MAKSKEWHAQPREWRAKEWKSSQSKNKVNDEDIYAEDEAPINKSGLRGVWNDVKDSFSDLPDYLGNAIGQIPYEIGGAAKQVFTDPSRTFRNLGQGAKNTADFLINPAAPAAKYFSKKEIPYLSELAKHWPQPSRKDLLGLGESQSGDTLIQSLLPYSGIGKVGAAIKGFKGVAARAGGYGAYGASQGDNPIQSGLFGAALEQAFKGAPKAAKRTGDLVRQAPETYAGIKQEFDTKTPEANIKSLRQKLLEAEEKSTQAEKKASYDLEKLKASENKATHRNVLTNPERLKGQINKEQKNIKLESKKDIQAPQVPVPVMPELPRSHSFVPLSGKSSKLLQTQEQKLAEVEKNINTHLGEGEEHHEAFAKHANATFIKKAEETNSENYAKSSNLLTKGNVVIKEPKEAKEVADHVAKIMGEHDIWSDEVSKLPNEVEEMNRSESVPAATYLRVYRSARNAANEAYHYQSELGGSSTSKGQKAYDSYRKLDDLQKKMYAHLHTSLPKEASKALQDAQDYFRNTIAPMRGNKTFFQIKKGKFSGSMMEHLIGTDTGQETLRKMVYSDPELMRLTIGQEYAGKPAKLHLPKQKLTTEFLPRMPKLAGLKEEHLNETKKLEEIKKLHDQSLEHDIEQNKIAKQRKNEQDEIKRKHEQALDKHAKEQDVAIQKAQDEKIAQEKSIKESEAKIRTYTKQIDVLRKRANSADKSTSEKLKAGIELKDIQDALDKEEKVLVERQKKWRKAGDLVLRLVGAKTLFNKFIG